MELTPITTELPNASVIKVTPNTPEWEAERRNGIGGSDAHHLWFASKYSDLVWLAKDKLGIAEPVTVNFKMEYGHYAESAIVSYANELMKRAGDSLGGFILPNCIYAHLKHDHIRMTPDAEREYLWEDVGLVVEIMDAKNTGFYGHSHFRKTSQPVLNYWIQMQHGMLVTGAHKAFLAMCLANETFVVWEIARHEEFIASHKLRCNFFWETIHADDVNLWDMLDVLGVPPFTPEYLQSMQYETCQIYAIA